jgi:hypothetical protein
MANPLKKSGTPVPEKNTHKGYNEKNPTQPQGAFKPDSVETPPDPNRKVKEKNSRA